MSTDCTIGRVREDKTVECITCHYDGDIGWIGEVLVRHYNSEEAAKAIIELGDLSELMPILVPPKGKEHSDENRYPGVTFAYHRDRFDPWKGVKPLIYESLSEFRAHETPRGYYWKNGKWWVDGSDLLTKVSKLEKSLYINLSENGDWEYKPRPTLQSTKKKITEKDWKSLKKYLNEEKNYYHKDLTNYAKSVHGEMVISDILKIMDKIENGEKI